MYFVNKEHERNYITLMEKKNFSPGQDPEYEAAYYITAHPEIYKCFDWNVYSTPNSPLGSFLYTYDDDEDEKEETKGFSFAPLTESTWQLVKVGQSLFNGYKVNLSDFPLYNEEMFNVLMQACRIRGRI
ncbi:hypothetical protein AALF16_26075 [Bacillus cereus]|uniref:hypothetical protein n=1 Tax=Bacillus cereus TaxID=1396 RepID=UPI00356E1501